MFVAKIKGLAIGLAAAAVVTTGVGVMAQQGAPGQPPAQDDRLGAVEEKLDRILEALGGARGEAMRKASRLQADRPLMKSNDDQRAEPLGPPVADSTPEKPGAAQRPGAMMQSMMGGQMGQMRGMMGGMRQRSPALESRVADLERQLAEQMNKRLGEQSAMTGIIGESRPIEARVADLERRLDGLERGFDWMVQRLPEPGRSEALERWRKPARPAQ